MTSRLDEIPLVLRPIAERLTGLGYEIDYKYLRPVGRPGYLSLTGRGRLMAKRGRTTLRVVLFQPRLRLSDNIHFYRWIRLAKKTGELSEFASEEDFWAFAEGGEDARQGHQGED